MTRNFHKWEVDPFFPAAEEVQDSADRLELVYRSWLHAKSVDGCANDSFALENHRRELSTALGTAKWQLEDFERAVSYLDVDERHVAAADDAPARHKQFVDAVRNQITLIETSLRSSGDTRDLKALPVVQLCREEKDDLALFLCGSKTSPHEDLKKTGYCTFPDEKVDAETFCTSSESVKSKNEVSDCFSTSASNSDMILSRGDFQSLDHYRGPHELGCTNRNIKDCLNLGTYADQSAKFFSNPAYKQIHVDEGRLFAVSESLQHQVYGDHNFLKDTVASYERIKNKKELKNNPTHWFPFTKKLSASDLKLSRSGLKRWKDGDAHSRYLESIQLGLGSNDLEKGQGSSSVGESLEGFSSRVIGVNAIGSIQRAIGFLVALGLVGLIFFHLT